MYAECHDLILELSDFFVRKDSLIYELGTATGTLAGRIAQRHAKKIRRVIGIDIEQAMVAEAARKCGMIPGVEFVEADLMAYRFEPCDLVISYYTLQFLRLEERHDVIRSIYDRLARGGAFVLFEKVREPDGQLQDLIGQLYLDYKLQHGFTPGEVMAKSRSIRSVLEPSTSEENQDALRAAGFRSVGIVHKSLCFEGYLAVK
ncbi:class I SAM-dependent methyltransferase [Streptomyces sp. NPDC054796]